MTSTRRDDVFGDLAFDEEMRGNLVKGNLVLSRAWYLREHRGDDVFRRVVRSLPAEAAALLTQPPMPFVWRPYGALMDVDRAIVNHAMEGDVARMREFGALIAEHDLSGIYRAVLKLGNPAFVLGKVSIACGFYFKDTTMRSEPFGPNRVDIILLGRKWPLYMCSLGVDGWFHSAVRVSGGHDVRVTHTKCHHRGDHECRWQVEWSNQPGLRTT